MLGSGNGGPARREAERAAVELLERHGAAILRTARRYSTSAEDAEDAYQRAVEILLTKAPSLREHDLVPWLKTVVKHEAFALRRQRERASPTADGEPLLDAPGQGPATDEQAERYERLRLAAEALAHLKPHEVRALSLLAEGYSYREICAETGWTYTKVNRCATEGRRAFLERVGGIEAGAECERLAPLLSALADGEAGAQDLAAIRPHLRSCLACRATLREYRAAPSRVAALLPALLAADPGGPAASVSRPLEWVASWINERAAGVLQKAHAAGEMASAQKVAAVAASTAALAGGGIATVEQIERKPEPKPRAERRTEPRPAAVRTAALATPPATARAAAASTRRAQPKPGRRARPRTDSRAAGAEFDPAGMADSGAASEPRATAAGSTTSRPHSTRPAPGTPAPAPSGTGAFAPRCLTA